MGEEEELSIELEVSEATHNAVLWYESEFAGQGREAGQTITKAHFVFVRTVPPVSTYFVRDSHDLLAFVRDSKDCEASKAILYSSEGFAKRSLIKRDVEKKVEKRSRRLCFLTCCFAICFAPCCPRCDKDVPKLNEDYYCSQMKKEYPDKCKETEYQIGGLSSQAVMIEPVCSWLLRATVRGYHLSVEDIMTTTSISRPPDWRSLSCRDRTKACLVVVWSNVPLDIKACVIWKEDSQQLDKKCHIIAEWQQKHWVSDHNQISST